MAYVEIPVETNGSFKTIFQVDEPEIIEATLYDSVDRLEFRYNFFLSPNDQLEVSAVSGQSFKETKVSGKGSNNNRPLTIYTDYDSIDVFYKDTLPD